MACYRQKSTVSPGKGREKNALFNQFKNRTSTAHQLLQHLRLGPSLLGNDKQMIHVFGVHFGVHFCVLILTSNCVIELDFQDRTRHMIVQNPTTSRINTVDYQQYLLKPL